MYKEKFITLNRSYKKLIRPLGVVLHETATQGATAENEYNYFNRKYRGASAHFFVDTKDIINTIPMGEQAWHAGQTANEKYLSVEMCNFSDPIDFSKVYVHTISLLADLFIQYKWEVNENTLLSHNDISHKYKETDHADPIAYLAKFHYDMDSVRSSVSQLIEKRKRGNKRMSIEEAKTKLSSIFSEQTLFYFECYKYSDELIIKIAENMK